MKLFSDLFVIIGNISWAADIVGVIISVWLGVLWYSQIMFGKIWMEQIGLSPEKFWAKAQNALLWHVPISFLLAANISAFCKHFNYHTAAEGALIGYDLGLVAILLLAIGYLYEQKSLCLYGINAGYIIISMSLMWLFIGILI